MNKALGEPRTADMTPNPYAPPAEISAPPDSVHVVGATLVVGRTATLPDVCVKCGAKPPEPIVRVKITYEWAPVWAFFWVFGLRFLRRAATLSLPVCGACWKRRARAGTVMKWTVGAAILLEMVGFWNAPRGGDAPAGLALFVLLLLGITIPMTVSLAYARPRRLPMVRYIDAQAVTLKEVSPRALEAFRLG